MAGQDLNSKDSELRKDLFEQQSTAVYLFQLKLIKAFN